MRLLAAVQVATVLQMWGTNVSLDLMDALKGAVALPLLYFQHLCLLCVCDARCHAAVFYNRFGVMYGPAHQSPQLYLNI